MTERFTPLPDSPEKFLAHPDYNPPQGLMALIGQVAEMRRRGEYVISLAGGLPPAEPLKTIWNYIPDVNKSLQQEIPAEEALQYGDASGNWRFRSWAAKDVSRLTGKDVSPENVLTTSPGLQSGIDDSLLILCKKVNKVALTQTPTYAGFLESAGEHSLDVPVVSIKSDREGIVPSSLEETIVHLKKNGIDPGLVYTMAISNPTGGIMSDQRGEELNEICKKYRLPLFIDYAYHGLTFSDLEENQIPRIPYLDNNVILGFSASKVESPAERVGYMVIPDVELYKRLKRRKEASGIQSPPKNELEIWKLVTRPDFSNWVKNLAKIYEEGVDSGMAAIEKNSDIFSADRPQGGMFLWAKVNNGASTWEECGRILKEQHIAYAPGIWSQPKQLSLPDGTLIGEPVVDNYMRICVTTEKPEVVEGAIDKLANAFRKGV